MSRRHLVAVAVLGALALTGCRAGLRDSLASPATADRPAVQLEGTFSVQLTEVAAPGEPHPAPGPARTWTFSPGELKRTATVPCPPTGLCVSPNGPPSTRSQLERTSTGWSAEETRAPGMPCAAWMEGCYVLDGTPLRISITVTQLSGQMATRISGTAVTTGTATPRTYSLFGVMSP
jgi:hypothetical protein